MIPRLKEFADIHLGPGRFWIPVAVAFLLLSFSRIDDGGTNGRARFTTMRAMADDYSFTIDRYVDWTEDWSRTPDGHYYSNKAPGPIFAGFPVFWVVDKILYPLQIRYPDEQGRRQAPRGIQKVAVAGLLQVLPFLLLTLLLLRLVGPMRRDSYGLAALAVLFGNTAAVLMTAYMGNPFTAVTMLAVAYFYLRGNIFWMSFFFGWTVLSEYTTGALLLPFFFLVWTERKTRSWALLARDVALGAAVPGFLWVWYHVACFGGPFALPYKFEVGATVGKVQNDPAGLWGFISFLPEPAYIYELLVGSARGILFTQPWIYVVIAGILSVVKRLEPKLRNLFWFSCASLSILLWINAGFPGWHGGGNSGPRYLAPALPLFGIFIPAFFVLLGRGWQFVLALGVGAAVSLRALVYSTWMLAPPEPLWPYHIHGVLELAPASYLYLVAFAAIMLTTGYWYLRKNPRL